MASALFPILHVFLESCSIRKHYRFLLLLKLSRPCDCLNKKNAAQESCVTSRLGPKQQSGLHLAFSLQTLILGIQSLCYEEAQDMLTLRDAYVEGKWVPQLLAALNSCQLCE